MIIAHTEASMGWGGQEIRTLREAIGMRSRDYDVFFIVAKGSMIGKKAQKEGFKVYYTEFKKSKSFQTIREIYTILKAEKAKIINTHSSLDSWLAGIAARLVGCKVIRTRHLSSAIRKGLNSKLLYKTFADEVVTTCEEIAQVIQKQAGIPATQCRSIPTGMDHLEVDPIRVLNFRRQYNIAHDDVLCGTTCVLRSWKGVSDLLHAAKKLEHIPNLKWLVIGSGPCEERYKAEHLALNLKDKVIFTGHLTPPYAAMAALDIFLLLSTGNEGVSQASLQAGYLKKPMVTTTVGGLDEVCLNEITGYTVPSFSADEVARKVQQLSESKELRQKMGEEAHTLVKNKFMFEQTLNEMEAVYNRLTPNKK